MGFWSRIIDPTRINNVVARLEDRIAKEREESARLRGQRANSIQAVQSGARAIEMMGNMIRMVADE